MLQSLWPFIFLYSISRNVVCGICGWVVLFFLLLFIGRKKKANIKLFFKIYPGRLSEHNVKGNKCHPLLVKFTAGQEGSSKLVCHFSPVYQFTIPVTFHHECHGKYKTLWSADLGCFLCLWSLNIYSTKGSPATKVRGLVYSGVQYVGKHSLQLNVMGKVFAVVGVYAVYAQLMSPSHYSCLLYPCRFFAFWFFNAIQHVLSPNSWKWVLYIMHPMPISAIGST